MSAWHAAAPYEGTLAGKQMNNSDMVAAFRAKTGKLPDEDQVITFALCQGIDQAVRATGSVDNGAIIKWLRSRTADDPVKTVMGAFNWDEYGLPVGKSFLMVQWQSGELKFVYPTNEFATTPMLSPKPTW